MSQTDLLSLIDAEISCLEQARALISGVTNGRLGQPKQKRKLGLTPEGRARIAAAVKARWARQKKVGQ
jgi:hypothetical protein